MPYFPFQSPFYQINTNANLPLHIKQANCCENNVAAYSKKFSRPHCALYSTIDENPPIASIDWNVKRIITGSSLRWRHNGHDCVSNHQPHHCLLKRLFGCRSNKTSTLRVTGLCAGNSPDTGEFPAQMASNAEMFPFDDVIMWLNI